jgi:peptidoglycan/xylan/chitin deacetylase (PgdA/CDA1 family)
MMMMTTTTTTMVVMMMMMMKCATIFLTRSWVLQSGRRFCLMSAVGSWVMRDSWSWVLQSERLHRTLRRNIIRCTACIAALTGDLGWYCRVDGVVSRCVAMQASADLQALWAACALSDRLYKLRRVLSCLYVFCIFTHTGNVGERKVKGHARTS